MNQNQYRSIPAELANHNYWMNWYPKPNPNISSRHLPEKNGRQPELWAWVRIQP